MKLTQSSLLAILALAASAAAQPDWSKLTPTNSPSARYGHALVFDAARGEAVLFGGHDDVNYLNDTWVFTTTSGWTKKNPASSPSPRRWHAMTYDTARSRVVLFSGNTQTATNPNDTWEWDGTNWSQRTLATSPSARMAHAMVYDSARGRTVLFGGMVGNAYNNETWEFSGSQWVQVSVMTPPGARAYHGLAFDSRRNRTVLFGGTNGLGYYSDFQEYDGANWSLTYAGTQIASRFAHGMAFDVARGRVVVFGGRNTAALTDTWEYENGNVFARSVTAKPLAHYSVRMTYLGAATGVLAFGGGTFPGVSNETLRYRMVNAATFAGFGSGCGPASGPVLGASAEELPYLGNTFTANLTGLPVNRPVSMFVGASNLVYAGVPLPIDLSPINMTGCILYTSIDLVTGLNVSGTTATWSATIPNQPALAGQNFFLQALVYEPGFNPLGLYLSNAAKGTVRAK